MHWLFFPMTSVVLSYQLILWILSIFKYIYSRLIIYLIA
nr:MAG TPA: Matrix protein 2 [Caudoviricetes sp.]